jgi:HEAT repeat protein
VKDFNFEIWRMQSESDIKGLIAALKDSNPLNRRAAAMALRTLSATTAIPSVQDALLLESDPELREIFVTTLESLFAQNKESHPSGTQTPIGDNRKVVRLIARLSGTHTEQAIRAAQELGDSREKLTIEALLMTFNNRKMAARVRLAVAEALLKLQSAPTEITLLAALRSEKWMIRRNAAGVLGQMQADWAVEPLIQTLRDPIEAVRRVARAALERIATPEALAAMHAPAIPDEDAPQTTLVYDKPVGTVIVESKPTPVVTPSARPPTPSAPVVEAKPPTPVEKPTAQPSENTPPATPVPSRPPILTDATDGIKAAAILDEPPPSEEDTKPIRPLPDDVS